MKKILPLACAALMGINTTAIADTQAYVDVLLDWAEQDFSDFFPPKGTPAKLENTISPDEVASLDLAAGKEYLDIVNQINAGKTDITLPASLEKINNDNINWLYRSYTNGNLLGVSFRLLTPAVTEVCALFPGLLKCFGTLPEVMTFVPAAAVDGPQTSCATVPTIATGTVVTYSVDNKDKSGAENQKIVATYTTTGDSQIVSELEDTSLDTNPPSVQNRVITQNIEVKNGWRSLKSLKIEFSDPEVKDTFTLTTNAVNQLSGPSSKYCLGQTWTTNVVKQKVTGQIVTADETVAIDQDTIDDSVKFGEVTSINDTVTIGSTNYNTVKVVTRNILTDITTTTWFDKNTGVDVKETLVDNRNSNKVIVETVATSIK